MYEKSVSSEVAPEARVIRAIIEIGPRNISEIARRTGLPVETVRYKVKHQLPRMGFSIRAIVNSSKLGLARYWVNLRFSKEYEKLAEQLLDVLSGKGYLTYYSRVLPYGNYYVMLMLPPEMEREYKLFLDLLVDSGVLTTYKMFKLKFFRHFSMRPEYFDFRERKWEFDWKSVETEVSEGDPNRIMKIVEEDSERVPFDKIDLLIIKSLQQDATRKISEIAEDLGIHPKTVRYHMLQHVMKRGMVDKYGVFWASGDDREVIWTFFSLVSPVYEDLRMAEEAFTILPFTIFDAISQQGEIYVAAAAIAAACYVDTLRFINRKTSISDPSALTELSIIDVRATKSYTIPVSAYSEDEGRWVLDLNEIESRVRVTLGEASFPKK